MADRNYVAKQGGKLTRTADEIIIKGMTPKEAILALAKAEEQDNMQVKVNAEFPDLYFTEALVSFMAAMNERYGEFFASGTPGWFGMKEPPVVLQIPSGPGREVQAIWGGFQVPGVEGLLTTALTFREGLPTLQIQGTIKQKYAPEIDALVALTNQLAKKTSIYRGQALELRFPEPEETPNPLDFAPKFMSLGYGEPPVFSDETQAIIENYVYEDIEATQLTKRNRMPIKKGILLEGPPGTGKTMLAHTLARKCQQNNWTFVYLRDHHELPQAINVMRRNGWLPGMVFLEDVDRAVGSERTDAVNEVLNVIDGVDAKGSDLVVLFTTNEINVIHKAMLRPGRLDVLISVNAPDAAAAAKLIRREAGYSLAAEEDLTEVGVELQGTMPAVIVQVVQRAKRAAQRRERLAGGTGFDPVIKSADLLIAARSMKNHIERLKPVPEDSRTPLEKAAQTLADGITKAAGTPLSLPNGWQEGWPDGFDPTVTSHADGKVVAPQPRRVMGKSKE